MMELATLAILPILNLTQTEIPPQPTEATAIIETIKKKPKPKFYKVVKNDSLTKIAKKNRTSVTRLWSANKKLKNQDFLEVGQKIRIPTKNEKLSPRPFYTPRAVPYTTQSQKPVRTAENGSQDNSGGGSNTYTPGQCTWYVKRLRPDIPNTWGNASDWLYNARRDGWSTGVTPRVGAIGWTPGHVVFITGVKGNTVTYTDMNGNWIPFEIGNGTATRSKYVYIY